jgi:hypothetical protein
MNITLSASALSKVDTYRKARGIRTRKAALEAMILEVAEHTPILKVAEHTPVLKVAEHTPVLKVVEHPLDKKLREARANPSKEKIPVRVQRSLERMRQERANGTLETYSLSEVMDGIRRRQSGN